MSNDFVVLDNYGGYYDDDGFFVICEEYGLTDFDLGNHFIEVQNGLGYYSECGRFCRFSSIHE